MYGAAAHSLAAVVGAKLYRVPARGDPVIGPIQLRLFRLVGCEVLERPEPRSGIQADYGNPGLGQTTGKRAATRSGADDEEVHFVGARILPHRYPAAGTEHIGCSSALAARLRQRIIQHADCPAAR